jgi:hypothetical protein
MLDDFESVSGWTASASEGVEISILPGIGLNGNCIEIKYNFTHGAGYCGIQKVLPLKLPENYRFSFYIKGDSPDNNLEFKLTDKSGENVWWLNQRKFRFPGNWTKQVIKKRNISFAWGPTDNKELKESYALQFYISSSSGGKGVIFLDGLTFEILEAPSAEKPVPEFSMDKIKASLPASIPEGKAFTIDLGKHYEYGGLILKWDEAKFPSSYKVMASDNENSWYEIYRVKNGQGGLRFLDLKGNESRYIRLDSLESAHGNSLLLNGCEIMDYTFTEEPENFFREIARHNKRGLYPRYLYDEQPYWTISGVSGDRKKALIGEDGAVEVDNSSFSLEPFIYSGGRLISWNEANISQELEKGYLPIPQVKWSLDGLEMEEKVFSSGEAGNSSLIIEYRLMNCRAEKLDGDLFISLRGFQVNPPWQFLNTKGGTARLAKIEYNGGICKVNDEKVIIPLSTPDGFGATEFDSGEITEYLSKDSLPSYTSVIDTRERASASYRYRFSLGANEEKTVAFLIPYYALEIPEAVKDPANFLTRELKKTEDFWQEKLNGVTLCLPDSMLVKVLKSNLAYILINRDSLALQPGSRSYKRAWIRDGSLISAALLRMGLSREVKEFIDWYSKYQFESGKVPCVVDERGADPVDENDSNGEFIYLVMEYYRFTQDSTFLKDKFPGIVKAVNYIDMMTQKCKADEFLGNGKKVFFGLMPESISHEGYSSKAMHSYWDDFFTLKGLKDAVEMAGVIKEKECEDKWSILRDEFRKDLYGSITLAMNSKKIQYIPGCAELGDFDATSTAIAFYPCGEMENLPVPYADSTFSIYYRNFSQRLQSSWVNYTPYELRLMNPFTLMDKKSSAHSLLEFFLASLRPKGWNAWAEVVWMGYRTPGFIGDLPHTWVSSEYINAIRNMLAYETGSGELLLAMGVKEEWLNGDGLRVRNLPTHFGIVSYSMKKEGDKVRILVDGEESILKKSSSVEILNPYENVPTEVKINGNEGVSQAGNKIKIFHFPTEIYLNFKKN